MRKNVCKHFAGTQNEKCDAGVTLAKVEKRGEHDRRSLPCYEPGHALNTLGATCELCQYPTDEELKAEEQEMRNRMDNMVKARQAIVDKIGVYKKGKSPTASGELACPVCTKGTLRFSRAGYNGHIHAGCTTPNCVAWME